MADFGKIKKNRFGSPGAEPLNFKVAPEFKRAFRQAALDEGLKLVELVEVCFAQCKERKND